MNGQGNIGGQPWMRVGRTLYFGAGRNSNEGFAEFHTAKQAQRHLEYLIEQVRLIAELRQLLNERGE